MQEKKITISLSLLVDMLLGCKDATGNPLFSPKQIADAVSGARDKATRDLRLNDLPSLIQFAKLRGEECNKHAFTEDRVAKPASKPTWDFLERIGVRPEDLISFATSIWSDWEIDREVDLVAGTHIGAFRQGTPPLLSHVASFFDLQGMAEFNSHLQRNVAGLQTRIRIEKPVLTQQSEYNHLTIAISSLPTTPHSLFSFGSPYSCVVTEAVVRKVIANHPIPLYVPRIWINHRYEQLLGDLFDVAPKDSTTNTGGGLVTRASRSFINRSSPTIEDFAFVGVRIPEAKNGPIFGFAAGQKQEGTLAGARALPRLIEDVYQDISCEHIVKLDPRSGIALVRAVYKTEDDTLSDRLTFQQDITLDSVDKEGWNFVTREEMKKLC